MNDSVETTYGRLNKCALIHARESYDISALLRSIEELRQLSEYLNSERGLGDSLMRLYCMAATVLRGSPALVSPGEGDLPTLLREVHSDLDEALAFFQSCVAVIEPLERLQASPDQRNVDRVADR
jgi:hypothetical protein